MKTLFEMFGRECEPGWNPLIDKLIADLKSIEWDGDIHQIKEKFGALRFYVGAATQEMYELIEKACNESRKICERCGASGETKENIHAWMKTLCDECFRGWATK